MLVLTRKPGETIKIGSDVVITFLPGCGHSTKVGIQAPRSVEIWRGEIDREPKVSVPSSTLEILLVEDNPLHVRIILRALAAKAKVEVAVSGEEAVEKLTSWLAPHLIVLDLKLPGMSGLDVLLRVRSHAVLQKTPCVMFSASDDQEDINSCFEAGANAFVVKSQNHEEFCASLHHMASFWGSGRRWAKQVSSNGHS